MQWMTQGPPVSVSALSDRGVRLLAQLYRAETPAVSVSALSDRGVRLDTKSCDICLLCTRVSVSALSDRGVRPPASERLPVSANGFSIRSFGSWGEARHRGRRAQNLQPFQYPLFRIVG